MTEADPLELLALHRRDLSLERTAHRFTDAFGESFGDDDRMTVDVVGGVIKIWMERDRQVRRNRPWRRRPDQGRDVAASGEGRHACCEVCGRIRVERKLDIDRR